MQYRRFHLLIRTLIIAKSLPGTITNQATGHGLHNASHKTNEGLRKSCQIEKQLLGLVSLTSSFDFSGISPPSPRRRSTAQIQGVGQGDRRSKVQKWNRGELQFNRPGRCLKTAAPSRTPFSNISCVLVMFHPMGGTGLVSKPLYRQGQS